MLKLSDTQSECFCMHIECIYAWISCPLRIHACCINSYYLAVKRLQSNVLYVLPLFFSLWECPAQTEEVGIVFICQFIVFSSSNFVWYLFEGKNATQQLHVLWHVVKWLVDDYCSKFVIYKLWDWTQSQFQLQRM